MRLGRDDCLLAGELASSLQCLMFDVGLPSMVSHSLPFLKSVSSLQGEAGVRLRCEHPQWNCHHGVVIDHCVVIAGACDAPVWSLQETGGWSFPLCCKTCRTHRGVLNHSPQRWWLAVGHYHKGSSCVTPLGERLRPPKQSVMNSNLPKRTVSLSEKPPHVRCSPSVATVRVDEWTIGTSRGKHATNPPTWRTNYYYFLHWQITGWSRSRISGFGVVLQATSI
jgi:hypothetical protein